MNALGHLDESALDAIARLCARCLDSPPSADELRGTLFAPEQPAIVRGDPSVGIVATVVGPLGAHIRLLGVDPDHRGRGRGHQLLECAEADALELGQTMLTTGADPPFFLWPGVPTSATDLCALFERHHYNRVETNYDVRVDLAGIPDDPGGHRQATESDAAAIDAFAAEHWANWRGEVMRALDQGNLTVSEDDAGLAAFCAFEVNRVGFLGPVAVRPELMGRGVGRAVLLGALWELRRRGRAQVDVSWVGPLVPYARVGGRIHTVYFVYQRRVG